MKKYIAFGAAAPLLVATLLATLTGTAVAADSYVGFGAGASRFNVDCAGLNRCDKTDVGVKFFGGYRYTPMIAGELAYIDFGKSKSTATQNGFQLEGVLKSHALVADVALRLPLMTAVDGIARVGVARVRSSLDQRADGQVIASNARTSVQPYLGLGLQYAVQKNISVDVGLDMTRAKLSSDTGGSTTSALRLLNAGVSYGF